MDSLLDQSFKKAKAPWIFCALGPVAALRLRSFFIGSKRIFGGFVSVEQPNNMCKQEV